jgi:hypothetical protein
MAAAPHLPKNNATAKDGHEAAAKGTQTPKDAARSRLRAKWEAFFTTQRRQARMLPLAATEAPACQTPPQNRSLALASANQFTAPEVISSQGGVLTATLEVKYGDIKIGTDPVDLRSYNGKLIP